MFVRSAIAIAVSTLIILGAGGSARAQTNGVTVSVHSGNLGWEGISVTGTAPAHAEVLLDVNELISLDLPTLSIGRYRAIANAAGVFSENIAVAPAYVRNSLITVRAELPGTSASATTTYRAPNADLNVPVWDDGHGL